MARCIVREIREGRGSPHGGVFLDIAWIKERLPGAEEHIRRKLPGMYHQFMALAGIDITKEAMEVGPTTHYAMGGVRVDPDTQMSTVPGLFAAGECAAGLHGANRLGGNSLSDLLVFGERAGRSAAEHAATAGPAKAEASQVEAAAARALAPFERSGQGEGPFQIQDALQELMQEKVGIVRTESEMQEALERIGALWKRAEGVGVSGNREYNPGWHTALDLPNLLTVAEAVTRSALLRRESRGAHYRVDCPAKDPAAGKYNLAVERAPDGSMRISESPLPPLTQELATIIQEMG